MLLPAKQGDFLLVSKCRQSVTVPPPIRHKMNLKQFQDDPAALIDACVEQIQTDVAMGYTIAIEDLLMQCSEDALLVYLLHSNHPNRN